MRKKNGTKRMKVTCTVQLIAKRPGPLRVALVRGDKVVAEARTRVPQGRSAVVLHGSTALKAGRYRVAVTRGAVRTSWVVHVL